MAFARAAADDGILLARQTFRWLCEQGHIGLERVASEEHGAAHEPALGAALDTLGTIYARLKGDVSVLTRRVRICCCPSSWCTRRAAR